MCFDEVERDDRTSCALYSRGESDPVCTDRHSCKITCTEHCLRGHTALLLKEVHVVVYCQRRKQGIMGVYNHRVYIQFKKGA